VFLVNSRLGSVAAAPPAVGGEQLTFNNLQLTRCNFTIQLSVKCEVLTVRSLRLRGKAS